MKAKEYERLVEVYGAPNNTAGQTIFIEYVGWCHWVPVRSGKNQIKLKDDSGVILGRIRRIFVGSWTTNFDYEDFSNHPQKEHNLLREAKEWLINALYERARNAVTEGMAATIEEEEVRDDRVWFSAHPTGALSVWKAEDAEGKACEEWGFCPVTPHQDPRLNNENKWDRYAYFDIPAYTRLVRRYSNGVSRIVREDITYSARISLITGTMTSSAYDDVIPNFLTHENEQEIFTNFGCYSRVSL